MLNDSASLPGVQLAFDYGLPIFPLDGLIPDSGAPKFTRCKGPKGRVIYRPNETMAELQQNFLVWLTRLNALMPYAHGGVRGRSIVTNALAHREDRYFYITDLKSAYDTVRPEDVAVSLQRYHRRLKSWPLSQTIDWLKKWCFLPDGGLVTGGAASPMLFNLHLAVVLDSYFDKEWLWLTGITYTRYLDDLVFSAKRELGRRMRRSIREYIWRAGFQAVDHKTRVNLDIHKGPIEIAGVMLDSTGRVFPSKRSRKRANGRLAAALSGKIDPAVAHGYVGACMGALPDSGEGRRNRPEVAGIRVAQLRLLQERPLS